MIKKVAIFAFVLSTGLVSRAQEKRITREEYFKTYGDLAVEEMKRSGIPASITLAQGSLESDNGNSDLAREGNNHFGIKCHNDWTGKRFYKDDDAKNECFRVYKHAEESYRDHTVFLKSKDRYAFLFELKPTDYKGWAEGLKKAGYATNPKYPELLIKIIDDNRLHEYDSGASLASGKHQGKKSNIDMKGLQPPPKLVDIDNNFEVSSPLRPFYKNNGVSYIVTKKSDTFESLAREFNLSRWQLRRYNDLTRDSSIRPREVVYIEPKKRRADKQYPAHIVQANENLHDIAQLYGVKMRKLAKRNTIKATDKLEVGSAISLR